MKRYQNPDLFERLALAYAIGTLHGKARLRFERLMERHLYLRATTQAYQQKFNALHGLDGLLPATPPPPRVWQRLERQLGLQPPKKPGLLARLQASLYWSAPALASVAAAVLTAAYLNFTAQPVAYVAALKSSLQPDQMVLAMADKGEMNIQFEMLAQAIPEEQGMTPTLWCISKNKDEPPIRMGTLTPSDGQQLAINRAMWQGLQDVSQLAISMEPADSKGDTGPMGKIVLSGDLKPLGKE